VSIEVERAGAKVRMKDVAQFDVLEEFQERVDRDPGLATAFRALTPGETKQIFAVFRRREAPDDPRRARRET